VPDVGLRFRELLSSTGWDEGRERLRLLCMHQTVEGARVGPVGYTFRPGADVVAGREIPEGLTAVLTGHIHRQQVLTRDLAGKPLQAPVLYPGSVERTSRAERDERKGYLILEVEGGVSCGWRFVELPARPMIDLELASLGGARLRERIAAALSRVAPDAVVRLKIEGLSRLGISEATVRSRAPSTMNVELVGWDERQRP